MIQTGRDERYIPEQPESDPSEDEEEIGSDTENKKEPELDDEQKEQMLEQMRIANPSLFNRVRVSKIYKIAYVICPLLIGEFHNGFLYFFESRMTFESHEYWFNTHF